MFIHFSDWLNGIQIGTSEETAPSESDGTHLSVADKKLVPPHTVLHYDAFEPSRTQDILQSFNFQNMSKPRSRKLIR